MSPHPERLCAVSSHPVSPRTPSRTTALATSLAASVATTLTLTLSLAALSGCTSPGPPPSSYRLGLDTPAHTAPATPLPASAQVWQLQRSVHLPAYLDRETLQLPSADNSLETLPGHRWAEPLRDAIPRVLQRDLALWLNTPQVWVGPPPAAWPVTRQIRVDILAFEALPSRAAVRLQARWSIESAPGQHGPVVAQADLLAASEGPAPAQLVQAHRLALWRLAECVARSAPALDDPKTGAK